MSKQHWIYEPSNAPDWDSQGVECFKHRDYKGAIECFQKAIALDGRYARAWNHMAATLQTIGQLEEAEHHARQAITYRSDYVEAHYNLGVILKKRGHWREAKQCYRRAIELRPGYIDAMTNLGNILNEYGEADSALELFQNVLDRKPNDLAVRYNCSFCLKRLYRLDQAEQLCLQILEEDDEFIPAMINLGDIYREYGDFETAKSWFERVLNLQPSNPDAKFGLSMVLFLEGKWDQAWPLYETRLDNPNRCVSSIPRSHRWDGSAQPDKTLVIICEQGLGDIVQFIRYVPLVRKRVGRLIFLCPSKFESLFRQVEGIDHYARNTEGLKWDLGASLLSLPALMGTTVDTVPPFSRYLQAPAEKVQLWRSRIGEGGCHVGLCWVGSKYNPRDRVRSLEFEQLLPLASVEGVHFHSLQVDEHAGGIEPFRHVMPVHDWSARLTDFTETAALIENLDLVITCDTSVAHLAGAMAKPVWMMVSYISDWRWLMDREDTPWYPTMRLFRQPAANDWSSVTDRIKNELAQWIQAIAGTKNPIRRAG